MKGRLAKEAGIKLFSMDLNWLAPGFIFVVSINPLCTTIFDFFELTNNCIFIIHLLWLQMKTNITIGIIVVLTMLLMTNNVETRHFVMIPRKKSAFWTKVDAFWDKVDYINDVSNESLRTLSSA